MRESEKGFTLVELSIVLVIIGLLISGLLVAQSMSNTAKIQAQVRQFQQFDIAVTNFHTKFNQIPGDCNICGNGVGNNNGKLEGDTVPAHLIMGEVEAFFSDLYNMQMLTTVYVNGVYGSFGIGDGKQFPFSVIRKGGILVAGNSFGDLYYSFLWGDTSQGSAFWVNGSSGFLGKGIVSPSEALAFDTKLDDGNPNTGNVAAVTASESSSTSTMPFILETDNSSSCVYNAKYNTSLTATNLCRIVVKSNFQ